MAVKLKKLTSLQKQEDTLENDILREKSNEKKINIERQQMIEEIAEKTDGQGSSVYDRRIRGNLERLKKEKALLVIVW